MKRSESEPPNEDRDLTGFCAEAQADGVPCYESGRQCETCARARPEPASPRAPRPPRRPPAKKR